MNKTGLILSNIVLALVLINCGGTPAINPFLEEAKSTVHYAASDTMISSNAPEVLTEAEQELARSHELWEDGADEQVVNHHAYLAVQKVAIAEETARINELQQMMAEAKTEHRDLMTEVQRLDRQIQQQAEIKRKAQQREMEMEQQLTELGAEKTGRGIILRNIHFDFDQATLEPQIEQNLSILAEFLQQYPERKLFIEGFTDSTGPDEYNRGLSIRRAEAVQQKLLDSGIDESRIQIRGYGKLFPVSDNAMAEGRQQNRRAEIVISDSMGVSTERIQPGDEMDAEMDIPSDDQE